VLNEWVREIFLLATASRPSESNPVVLVMDNFHVHLDPTVLMNVVQQHVYVILLPPHSSHKLQPLDVGAIQPFKHWVHKAIHDSKTSKDAFTASNVVSAFQAYGFHPVD